jgi:hypothetical protein
MSETYPYEQLDGIRFQRLVQCLLTAENPGIQCFPLSGSDGGRDAIEGLPEGGKLADSIVYQVKFKEPQPLGTPSTQDLYEWLTDRLRRDLAAVRVLKERGVTQYMVVTNLIGTGGLDSGLRDRVKEWAAQNIPLPTRFWWRDDLDARLPRHYDLIFRFGLFRGPESVRAMLEARFENLVTVDGPIRRSETPPTILALMSYLAEQYRLESKLRFEQADLPGSPLLDLFVDVATSAPDTARNRRIYQTSLFDLDEVSSEDAFYMEHYHHGRVVEWRMGGGAAELLLADEIPPRFSKIVIEGAPGQGKSTLGQYVCQVHRMRLLDKKEDLSKLSAGHAATPIRLPIRVEFRYLAAWFSGTNPWNSERMSEVNSSQYWAMSLESFIAAHVRHSTGGLAFTPDDVVSILSRTPSFIFLDGLDEIADIGLRRRIVRSAEASLSRLESLGADMRILVTTRPAIFVKSPGFSRKGFQYLQLASLTRPLIDQYTRAWVKVRDLREEEVQELLDVLEANLEQTHVAELARNPMQLAILLYLISVKGRSLPEQRTALYEQYLTAFLDRESRKSSAVHTHRKPLLQLHGFLGWLLHSRAESQDSRYAGGDISLDELRQVFSQYLDYQERSTDLVDELFEGAERVFVLVSRNQGRFEFEVQPLREFFAARYLYKTAPHSTSASPKSGAKPHRLEQLIRNPYWINVARFFCGWYDEGELADLSRHLQDLCEDSDYRLLGHPRYLIEYILQDYTMAEAQRDTRMLVESMADPLGIRLLTSRHSRIQGTGSGLSGSLLISETGLESWIKRLRSSYISAKTHESVIDLARALRQSDAPAERAQWWLSCRDNNELSKDQWLQRGIQMDAVAHISLSDALEIFDPSTASSMDWIRCVEAGRFDVGLYDPARFEKFAQTLANGFSPMPFTARRKETGRLWTLPNAFSISRFSRARIINSFADAQVCLEAPIISESMRETVRPLDDLAKLGNSFGDDHNVNFKECAARAIQAIEDVFGECWVGWQIALVAGTTPRYSPKIRANLADSDASALVRARTAKLSGNDLVFWMEATSEYPESSPLRLAIWCALLAWADPQVLKATLPPMGNAWERLEPHQIRNISSVISSLTRLSGSGRNAPRPISLRMLRSMPKLPSSMLCVLYWRTTQEADPLLAKKIRSSFSAPEDLRTSPHGSLVANFLTGYLLASPYGKPSWRRWLADISAFHNSNSHGNLWELTEQRAVLKFNSDILSRMAHIVLESPDDYPALILNVADTHLSAFVSGKLKPLRQIASEGEWFPGLPG